MKWRDDFTFSAPVPLMPFWRRFAEIGGTIYLGGSRRDAKTAKDRGCLFTLDHRDPLRLKATELAGDVLSSPGVIAALGSIDDTLYVGGTFFTGVIAYYLPVGTASWHLKPVSGGAYSAVRSILGVGAKLFIGGRYISYDGNVANLGSVDPLHSVTWTPLSDPLDTSNITSVDVLVSLGADKIAVGGRFFHSGSSGDLNSIALLDLTTGKWKALGPALHTGVLSKASGITSPGSVNAIWKEGQTLYVGGDFDEAGDVKARGVAAYDLATDKWSSLDDGVTGLVNDLFVTNGKLVVGGMFTQVGSTAVASAGVAYWDIATKKWKSMDEGVTRSLGPQVMTLQMVDGYTLVGGLFDKVGSTGFSSDGLALWDWS